MSAFPAPNVERAISLLSSISLGSGVAEHDSLLHAARVETSTFSELFRDKVDLVPGTKGSGKTALYRLISEYLKPILIKSNVAIITGVEASGDPVFQAFRSKLETLNEQQFENFWRIYFVALVLDRLVKNPEFDLRFSAASKERENVLSKCKEARIPECGSTSSLKDVIEKVFNHVKLRFGVASASSEGGDVALLEIQPVMPNAEQGAKEDCNEPLFLQDIHEAIVALLKRSRTKVWILLDRLDEVFPRRSKLERIALRSLLRTTRSFPTEMMRIKIFLRDDIFENVILKKEGFTALSHIEARKAPTLRWNAADIQLMILKRMALNTRVRTAYSISPNAVSFADREYVKMTFDKLFSPQVRAGENQASTIDWIYHHCSDGRGVVTPRDVLDLLEYAIKAQIDLIKSQSQAPTYLIGAQALKEALVQLSAAKCRVYLEAEFPDFWPEIRRFQNSKAEHNHESLEHLLGPKWHELADDLVSIGFLQIRPKTNTYIIPFLFRSGMGVRQGKAFGNSHN